MRLSVLIVLISLFLSMLAVGCSNNAPANAGTIEVTNGQTGKAAFVVKDADGKPLSGVVGRLEMISVGKSENLTISSLTATSNDSGVLHFDELAPGKYTLICEDSSANLYAIRSRIEKPDGDYSAMDSPILLQNTVTLYGRVVLSAPSQADEVQVRVPGTGVQSSLNADGFYNLQNIPVGSYDLSFVFADTVNFLPVTISAASTDTVYVPDVVLFGQAGDAATPYSFLEHEQSTALSITERKYKSETQPQWYAEADFSNVTVYAISEDSLTEDTAEPRQILFLTEIGETPFAEDHLVVNHLERMGNTVFMLDQDDYTTADTTGMDAIYISYHITSSSFPLAVGDLTKPLIICEPQLYMDFGMTEVRGSAVTGNKQYLQFNAAAASHPILAGLEMEESILFADSFLVVTDSATFNYALPPIGRSTILAVNPLAPEQAMIFVYDSGEAMFDSNIAPAKRIGYYTKTRSYTAGNPEAWELFDQVVDWALE